MRRLLLIVALTCCAATLVSCAPATPVPKTAEPPPLVWPSEPDPPRIAYVRTFTQPDDLGIARGFFQRIADAIFGGSESRLVRPMAVVAS